MIRTLALLTLLTSALMTSAVVHAEIGGYRVEVILFQNLQANVDTIEVDSLRNYANIPELIDSSLPDELDVLSDRSERMEGVWRRLRSSQGYRPLVYSSWVQNNIDYYPPFRVHDEVVVDTQIRVPTNIVVADLDAQDPLQAFRSTFYQLDGSVQLRLSRFLHINLNLEYRVAAKNTNRSQASAFSSPVTTDSTASDDGLNSNDTLGISVTENAAIGNSLQALPGHDVYRLKQSRQVKTDRLQYFDSPWFGALVLVIPIAAEPLPQMPQQIPQQEQQEQQEQQTAGQQEPQTAQQQLHLTNNN